MRRSSVLLVMLLAMLWQGLAIGPVGGTVIALDDIGHAMLHWQQTGHHHHEDGSYHLDDSNESAQHVLCDQVCAAVALLASTAHGIPLLGSTAPGGLHPAPVPDPDPEGLLRPPRFRA